MIDISAERWRDRDNNNNNFETHILSTRGERRHSSSYVHIQQAQIRDTCIHIIYRQLVHLSLSLSFSSFPARTSTRASSVPASAMAASGSPAIDPEIRSILSCTHSRAHDDAM